MNTAIKTNECVDQPAKVEERLSMPPSPKLEPMPLGKAWGLLMADMRRKRAGFASRPEDRHFFKRYIKLNLELGSIAVMIFRYGQWAIRLRNPVLRLFFSGIYWIFNMAIMVVGGINIQAANNIGPGFVIHNFSCIFILSDNMGENCTVNQGVTIGNVRGSGALPQIGNNVYFGAGCKVLGNVKVGDNTLIAANSLVLTDVPENSTMLGVPARVVARNTLSEYLKF
jgi:serine O-acetyltransferase